MWAEFPLVVYFSIGYIFNSLMQAKVLKKTFKYCNMSSLYIKYKELTP
jgi:hypothetical protein